MPSHRLIDAASLSRRDYGKREELSIPKDNSHCAADVNADGIEDPTEHSTSDLLGIVLFSGFGLVISLIAAVYYEQGAWL
jgi:hypothetical protein